MQQVAGLGRRERTRGEIGKHARFRFLCRKAWGFESLRVHHHFPICRAVAALNRAVQEAEAGFVGRGGVQRGKTGRREM